MGEPVVIVPTGVANLASVEASFARAGVDGTLAESAAQVEDAARVMLPGVGAFGPAMEALEELGFADALRTRVLAGRATMAICLGLQLLFEESDESPGARGLGVLPGRVLRFPASLTVPHMGWNRVRATAGSRLLRHGYAYFANSFFADGLPLGWEGADCEYGRPFVAALERGPVLACQFHPELSGAYGLELMKRWLAASEEGRAA